MRKKIEKYWSIVSKRLDSLESFESFEYHTVTACTRNEDNLKEVEIVYPQSFWQRLFGKSRKTCTFVHDKEKWVHKDTKKPVTRKEQLHINFVIAMNREIFQ